MQAVGAAIGEDLGQRQTRQGQISQQVQELMADRFIGEAQGRVEPAVAITDQGIVETTAPDQSGGPQGLHLVAEAEGASGGDLAHEALGCQRQRIELAADRCLRKLDAGTDQQGLGGQGRDETQPLAQHDRFNQRWRQRPGSEAVQARFRDRLHPGQTGAIEQRNLLPLHQDLGLADATAGQGRQQMFNGGQAPRAELQSRAQLGVAHLARLQAQQRQLGGIEPADPVAGRFTGLEPHPGVLATMQTHAIALHRAGQGPGLGVITRPRAHQNFQPTPRLKRQLPERSWLATSRRSGPTGVVTIRPVPTEKPWPGLPSRPPGLPGTLA